MRRPVDRVERRLPVTVAGPARHTVGKRFAITARVVVGLYVPTIADSGPAVRHDTDVDSCIEDRTTNRDGDAVFARAVESLVGRAATRCRQSVDDPHEVPVLARVGVAAVGHEHAVGDECEFEGFVLGASTDAFGELESPQWMCFVGRNQFSPHPSGEHKRGSAVIVSEVTGPPMTG